MSPNPKNVAMVMVMLSTILITGCYTANLGYNPYPYAPSSIEAQLIGILSANPYLPDSSQNPYGAGSKYNPNSVNNPYGKYGSSYSPTSAQNPYATSAPKLYDENGNYRGKLSTNPYDADSTSNPYGAGSRYAPGSPNNPYSTSGWKIIGQ